MVATPRAPVPHPDYDDDAAFPDTFDIGVVQLEGPGIDTGGAYGTLPTAVGQFDDLRTEKGPPATRMVEVVGYWLVGRIPAFADDEVWQRQVGARRSSTPASPHGRRAELRVHQQPGVGTVVGGTCSGDLDGNYLRVDLRNAYACDRSLCRADVVRSSWLWLRVSLGLIGPGPAPSGIDGTHPSLVPAIEVLVAERVSIVDLAVSDEQRAVVPGLAEEDSAPVVDEPRDVHGPVGCGDFLEDRSKEVVEDDLAMERDDEVVDRGACVKVTGLAWRRVGRRNPSG